MREKNLTIIALPEIQETSDVPCDVGSDVSALQKEIKEKNLPVDIELVPENWNDKVSRLRFISPWLIAVIGIDMAAGCLW